MTTLPNSDANRLPLSAGTLISVGGTTMAVVEKNKDGYYAILSGKRSFYLLSGDCAEGSPVVGTTDVSLAVVELFCSIYLITDGAYTTSPLHTCPRYGALWEWLAKCRSAVSGLLGGAFIVSNIGEWAATQQNGVPPHWAFRRPHHTIPAWGNSYAAQTPHDRTLAQLSGDQPIYWYDGEDFHLIGDNV